MITHAPAPWHVGAKDNLIIYDALGWPVSNASTYHARTEPGSSQANARLIAEAPAMADALRAALDLPVKSPVYDDFFASVRGILARIDGAA